MECHDSELNPHNSFELHAEKGERTRDHEPLKVHIPKWLFHEKYPELKYLFSQSAPVSFQDLPFGY